MQGLGLIRATIIRTDLARRAQQAVSTVNGRTLIPAGEYDVLCDQARQVSSDERHCSIEELIEVGRHLYRRAGDRAAIALGQLCVLSSLLTDKAEPSMSAMAEMTSSRPK